MALGWGNNYPWWKYYKRPEPSLQDLKEIQKRSQATETACFMFETRRILKYKSNSIEDVTISGVSHEYNNVMTFELEEGRYFTQSESQSGNNVAIMLP